MITEISKVGVSITDGPPYAYIRGNVCRNDPVETRVRERASILNTPERRENYTHEEEESEEKNGRTDRQTDGMLGLHRYGPVPTIKSIFHTRHLSYTRDNGCVWRYGINISR